MKAAALLADALSTTCKLPLGQLPLEAVMKHQLRNRQRETTREILEGPIPAMVTLPEAPSIEFVTPRRIFLKAIWTGDEPPKLKHREFKHRGCRRIAVLETPEGNRIALLDAPEDRSRYFRYDNPHHRDPVCETIMRTDLALGVDLKRWRRDPMLVPAADNPNRIQAIIDQCRWVYPHIPLAAGLGKIHPRPLRLPGGGETETPRERLGPLPGRAGAGQQHGWQRQPPPVRHPGNPGWAIPAGGERNNVHRPDH